MQNAFVVTGTLKDANTVTLGEALPPTSSRVRLVVEPLPPSDPRPYHEVMAAIRERQRDCGHVRRTREAIDAELQAEREGWPG